MAINSERCDDVGFAMVMVFCAFNDGRRKREKVRNKNSFFILQRA
jgi:hypothetical protein